MHRFLALLAALLPLPVTADDLLILRNQHEITGTIVQDDGDTIVIQTGGAEGRLSCRYEDLAFINGLAAPRVRELRLEVRRAEATFAKRGIAAPIALAIRGRDSARFSDDQRASKSPPPPLAALAAFGLAARDVAAGEAVAAWRAARRHAAADLASGELALLVPADESPDPFAPFWIAAGARPPAYAVTREFGAAALDAAAPAAQAAARRLAGSWSDAELALEAARTGTAAAVALDALLDPPGLSPDQGEGALALTGLGDVPASPDTPPFLAAWRVFAQRDGARFAITAKLAGGWRLAFQVLDDPPASTEQILHPEKYFVDRDPPARVQLADLPLPRGAESFGFVARGTMGEAMMVESFRRAGGPGGAGLDEQPARRAAAGWDGDAWIVYASRDGTLALVWLSTWDTPEDAREFAEAAAAAGVLRRGRGKSATDGTRIRFESAGARGVAEWKDRDCVVVEGLPTDEAAAALAESAWAGRSVREEPSAPLVLAPREAVAAALATSDALAKGWVSDPPNAVPLGGRIDQDPNSGARTFRAAGAFTLEIPDGWEARAEPSALVLTPASGLLVTATFHRLAAEAPPALVFARARALASPRGDAPFLPYPSRTADGRAWCQFVIPHAERRTHHAWTVAGKNAIRLEAVAPAAGATDDLKKELQAMLATVRFE
ncbi:MAG: hypothetical protein AAB074_09805 [Planctomycetota bacterium]